MHTHTMRGSHVASLHSAQWFRKRQHDGQIDRHLTDGKIMLHSHNLTIMGKSCSKFYSIPPNGLGGDGMMDGRWMDGRKAGWRHSQYPHRFFKISISKNQ